MDRMTAVRFWDKTVRFGGCLLWAGAKTSNGYGTFYANGKTNRAHRFAYELCKGEIPLGKQLDHLCRNRLCVNPEHLEAVTQRENILRGVGASARNATKTHCPAGHPLSGENLYMRPGDKRECRICRKKARPYYKEAKNEQA